jgi:hypothetical protein
MIIQNLVKTVLLATVLTGLAQNASAQTVIDAVPYTIASPGVYELGKNLTFPSALETGNAITINASNVTIDFNSFNISKLQSGKTPQCLGIYALNRTNITVKNGSISGFYVGIDFDYRSGMNLNANHLVDGVRITNPQAFGVLLTQATNCLIQNCVIVSTGFDSAGNTVSGSGVGIELSVSAAAANALIGNRIAKSLQTGIQTGSGKAVGGTFLEGNLASKCPVGFALSQGDKYRNNITISCATPFNANGAIDLGGNN